MNKRINISASELKSALAGFNKIINKRTTLPALGSVLIESDKEGRLQLAATNLDDYVFRRVPADCPAEFKALVPFSDLHKVVNACSGEDRITLEQEGENFTAKYTIAGTSFTEMVASLPVQEFPALPSCQ